MKRFGKSHFADSHTEKMGALCCCAGGPDAYVGGGRKGASNRISLRTRSRMVGTREPLLKESEREAVSNLLRFLEQGEYVRVD